MEKARPKFRGIAVSGLVPPHSEVMSLFRQVLDEDSRLRRVRLLSEPGYKNLADMDWALLKATAKRELLSAIEQTTPSSPPNVIFSTSLGTMLTLIALDDLIRDDRVVDPERPDARGQVHSIVCYGCPYQQSAAFKLVCCLSYVVVLLVGRTPFIGSLIKLIPIWRKWHCRHQRSYWIPLGAVAVIFSAHAEFRRMVIRYASEETAFSIPVAFLHGTEDRLSRWSGSRRVAKLLRQKFVPIELAGSDPSSSGDPIASRALLRKTRRFIFRSKS